MTQQHQNDAFLKDRGHMRQNQNDVLVEGNWTIVLNERPYDIYGNKKRYIWFNMYHDHPHCKANKGLCHAERAAGSSDGGWICAICTRPAPDVVEGYMNLIVWRMEDAD